MGLLENLIMSVAGSLVGGLPRIGAGASVLERIGRMGLGRGGGPENINFEGLPAPFRDSPNQDALQAAVTEATAQYPETIFGVGQLEADETARGRQREIVNDPSNPLNVASDRVGRAISTGEQAISQETMDRMVNQFLDANRAEAAGRARAASNRAAATGASPESVNSEIMRSAEAESAANNAARRDVAVQRELANADFLLRLLGLGSTIGSAQTELRAGVEQPADIAGLGALITGSRLSDLGMGNEAILGLGNAIGATGDAAYGSFMDRLNTQLLADAMRPRSPFSGAGSITGGLAGATAGLATGGPLGGILGGTLGATGGGFGSPYVGMLPSAFSNPTLGLGQLGAFSSMPSGRMW